MSPGQAASRPRRPKSSTAQRRNPISRKEFETAEPFIKGVAVNDLYKRFSYKLTFNEGPETSGIDILYGDNGTGKSTILRLIYAALCPNEKEGLRSYLSITPFSSFELELSTGHKIAIRKSNPKLVGDYSFTVSYGGKRRMHQIKAEKDLRVVTQPGVRGIEEALTSMGFSILFVDHNRRIRSTPNFFEEGDVYLEEERQRAVIAARHSQERVGVYRDPEMILPIPLDSITAQVSQWLRLTAIQRGYTGDVDALEVYLDVVRGLSKKKLPAASEPYSDKGALIDSIQELRNQSSPYIRHGLASEFPFSQLIELISEAPQTRMQTIGSIVGPFVDSLLKRLNAAKDLQNIISTFEEELNKYLRDKRAIVNVLRGISLTIGNEDVDLESLSSGEQQLILLFSLALLSKERKRLIIIDEPEISLNYNWQRTFVGSLRKISASAHTQFFFATHSLEMISKHKHSAVELA
jgi:ABC-type molybdenum transport system ATPase subunit/photorepair protein PhrA